MTQLYKTCLKCEHGRKFNKDSLECMLTNLLTCESDLFSKTKDFDARYPIFKAKCINIDKIKVLEELEDL